VCSCISSDGDVALDLRVYAVQCVAACCSVLQCVAVCCSDSHAAHTHMCVVIFIHEPIEGS